MNEKAIISFTNKREEILCQLKSLDALMNVEDHYSLDEIHYGHVGNLAYVEKRLDEVIAFLRFQDNEVEI